VHGHVSNKLFTIVFHSFEVIRTSTDRKSLLIKLNVVAVIFTFPCRRYSTAHFMSCWQTFHVYISTTFNRVPREQEFRGVQLLAQLEHQQYTTNCTKSEIKPQKYLQTSRYTVIDHEGRRKASFAIACLAVYITSYACHSQALETRTTLH
jgi:c-di-AMP phosphodiesterase-like protein